MLLLCQGNGFEDKTADAFADVILVSSYSVWEIATYCGGTVEKREFSLWITLNCNFYTRPQSSKSQL